MTIRLENNATIRPVFGILRAFSARLFSHKMFHIDDTRIADVRPLLPPAILLEELPLTQQAESLVAQSREQIGNIILGNDDRLLVIVGPCSIHDPTAALDFAKRLKPIADQHQNELLICMRTYFEKPRTVVGWKGLINDPDLDGSFNINKGLRTSRKVLLDVLEIGLPTGAEFLDTIIPQYIADAISWSAIGARTTESQVHRELASGLSMPVGFKNATSGDAQIAIDAVRSASHPHWFPSVTKQGVSAIFETMGNPTSHVILRGGNISGPNYDAEAIESVVEKLTTASLPRRLVVDCSHGNSNKDYARQPVVAEDLAKQIAHGSKAVAGIMLESHLIQGRQDYNTQGDNTYGQSITDACLGFADTVPVLAKLAESVKQRRE